MRHSCRPCKLTLQTLAELHLRNVRESESGFCGLHPFRPLRIPDFVPVTAFPYGKVNIMEENPIVSAGECPCKLARPKTSRPLTGMSGENSTVQYRQLGNSGLRVPVAIISL